jgi:hypothetical protein
MVRYVLSYIIQRLDVQTWDSALANVVWITMYLFNNSVDKLNGNLSFDGLVESCLYLAVQFEYDKPPFKLNGTYSREILCCVDHIIPIVTPLITFISTYRQLFNNNDTFKRQSLQSFINKCAQWQSEGEGYLLFGEMRGSLTSLKIKK